MHNRDFSLKRSKVLPGELRHVAPGPGVGEGVGEGPRHQVQRGQLGVLGQLGPHQPRGGQGHL